MFGVEPSNIRGRWLEKGPSCDAQRRCHGWKASVVGFPYGNECYLEDQTL